MKVALVTGGAKRLGFEFAKALAKKGYSIALSLQEQAPKKRAAPLIFLEGKRGPAPRHSMPTSPPTARRSNYSKKSSLLPSFPLPLPSPSPPRLDALVHAASPWIPKPVSAVTLDDWEAVFRAGPRAAFFLAQAAAPELARSSGSILFVSDVAATQAWPTHVPHAAAKAAINALVRNLAVALGPNVRVNAIAPGSRHAARGHEPRGRGRARREDAARARPVAVDDLMAMAVAILENRSMTGQVVTVDAGRTLAGE